MIKIGMTFNGKQITSSGQFEREFKLAARKALGDNVRRAAPREVRVSRTRNGFKLEGPQEAVERTVEKLGAKPRRAR